MTQEEIIEDVLKFLKFIHGGAYMGQEPYKTELFALFKKTYENGYFEYSSKPLLTGDALAEILVVRWANEEEGEEESKKRLSLIQRLTPMWDEWRYAWDKYDL